MTKSTSVAKYLEQMIAISDVTQRQIADECGYEKSNIITMFKQGKTRIPLDKVGPIARALGIDPLHFMRLVMTEYAPETWAAIEPIIGAGGLLSEYERKLVALVNEATDGAELDLDDEKNRQTLLDAVLVIRKADKAKIDASVERHKRTSAKRS